MNEFVSALLGLFKDSTIPLAFIALSAALLIWKRRAQPSALTIGLILVPVLFFMLSVRWEWMAWFAWTFTPLLMLALLLDTFFLTPHPQYLDLIRMISPKLSVGRRGVVELQLFNNSHLPLQIEVCDSVPSGFLRNEILEQFRQTVLIPAFGNRIVGYEIHPAQRGIYSFGKIHVRYRSRLGLLWITSKGGRLDTVKVTPDMQRIRQMRIHASRTVTPGELQKRTLGLEGTQFSGLRHYFAGDDVKKMAWQATAKLDIPVIRTFEHEVKQPILVLLDAGRKMSGWINGLCKYDWALNAALAFMSVAIDRKDDVAAAVFSNRLITQMPFGMGSAHWRTLLEKLSETEVQLVEPDYAGILFQIARHLKQRTLIILFTDLIDPAASKQLMQGLKAFGKNHILMIVTLSDPDILVQATSTPQNAYEAYQKGVALDLLELRRQALAILTSHHRAVVIDVPPDKLDETLIQRYLKIKQRALV
jgi:uncharacterized protein (DUF58 family)